MLLLGVLVAVWLAAPRLWRYARLRVIPWFRAPPGTVQQTASLQPPTSNLQPPILPDHRPSQNSSHPGCPRGGSGYSPLCAFAYSRACCFCLQPLPITVSLPSFIVPTGPLGLTQGILGHRRLQPVLGCAPAALTWQSLVQLAPSYPRTFS